MKLRRILVGAAIGATAAIIFKAFVSWQLPWAWDWHNNGTMIRIFIAWAACSGAIVGAIGSLSRGGRV